MWVHPVRFGGLKPCKSKGFRALEAPGLTKTMVWELSRPLRRSVLRVVLPARTLEESPAEALLASGAGEPTESAAGKPTAGEIDHMKHFLNVATRHDVIN